MDLYDVGSSELIEKLNNINLVVYKDKLNTDIYTLDFVVN